MRKADCSKFAAKSLLLLLKVAPPLCLLWIAYICTWPYSLLYNPVHFIASQIAILGWAVFYAIAALFPLWLFQVTRRLQEKCDFGLPFSPWMAALCFFIPIAQIGLPYSIMKSVLFRLEHRTPNDKSLNFWWASWIALFFSAVCGSLILNLFSQLLLFKLASVSLYGSATIFCWLSAKLVERVESSLAGAGSANAASGADVPWYQQALSNNSTASGRPLLGHSPVDQGVVIKFARAAREKIRKPRNQDRL